MFKFSLLRLTLLVCQQVFKMEYEEYKREEIDWSYIDYVDNQDILDCIEQVSPIFPFHDLIEFLECWLDVLWR